MIGGLILAAVKQAGVMAGAGQQGIRNLSGNLGDDEGLNKSETKDVLDKEKQHMKKSGNFFTKMLGKGAGMTGISLSMSSLLRQSQIFTGTIGAFFQIVGGFIDVLLAPFMPILAKVMQILAAQIPRVRELAQKGYDWLETNVFPILSEGFDYLKRIWDRLSPDLFAFVKDEFKKTIDFWKEQWEKIKDTFSFITADLPAIMQPISNLMAEFGMKVSAGDFGTVVKKAISFMTDIGRWQIARTIDIIVWGIKYVAWPFVKTATSLIVSIVQTVMNIWRLVTDFDNYKAVFMAFLKDKFWGITQHFIDLIVNVIDAVRAIKFVPDDLMEGTRSTLVRAKENIEERKTYQRELENYMYDRANLTEAVRIDLTLNGQPIDANETFGQAERRLAVGLGNQHLLADAGGFNEGGG